MSRILCSEGFARFIACVAETDEKLGNLEEKIREGLLPVQKELHLGRVYMVMEVFPMKFQPDGETVYYEFLGGADASDAPKYEKCFPVEKTGIFHLMMQPEEGHSFTEEEKDALDTMAQLIFITMRRGRLNYLVEKVITTDSMAGVRNFLGMKAYAERMIAEDRIGDYCCIFMNIKNFRYYNQKLTAANGDKLLRFYSKAMSDFMAEDECFARMGGDNFAAFVRSERIDDFIARKQKIKIEIEINGDLKIFDVETRMGVYRVGADDDLNKALNSATIALSYVKKQNISNVQWFELVMREKDAKEQNISVNFPAALKRGELVAYYQPKILLSDGSLYGCEALVRWIQDDGQIISPGVFIPALEREGSICELDFYVFEQVCKDIRKWIDSHMNPVRVSVNFSKLHFRKEGTGEKILEIIRKYNISPELVEIELTEASSLESLDNFVIFTKLMRNNNIPISIDDFGTGYSSLNNLKRMDVDIIKLDKTFIDPIRKNEQSDNNFIKNIVHMINELGMEVVAEGVETANQVDFLKDISCKSAQGYLFDHPLPVEEYEKRLCDKRFYE